MYAKFHCPMSVYTGITELRAKPFNYCLWPFAQRQGCHANCSGGLCVQSTMVEGTCTM